MTPSRGLYEELISQALAAELDRLGKDLAIQREPLDPAEAGDRLALYIGRLIARSVDGIPEGERLERGLRLAEAVINAIGRELERPAIEVETPVRAETLLRSISRLRPDGSPESIKYPDIPLLDTTLLTNSPGETALGHQILTEIDSADRIDLVMAFIRRSGTRPFVDALRKHCAEGRPLRILTTTYTGSTEGFALQELRDLGAEVRVSYDLGFTRLHAKAWVFGRDTGFSTAFVGSSNLTHTAQVSGLEWNVRVSEARNPDVLDKIRAVFASYWESRDFEVFNWEDFEERRGLGDTAPALLLSPVELRLEPFQERLLEEIEVARERGRHRNLLVAATGTGKTVMAAVDYARLRERLPRARLLFVAHRAEILEQSVNTYRYALRDRSFGELWVGGQRPRNWEHVFASVQSLRRADLSLLPPDHFDVVVVDEFHHAAAQSYTELLEYVQPRELLGLTATPERADGLPVLDWFDGRIAAELRLWDAIDQHRLVPFVYYGIHDGLDLRSVPWKRGRGYDTEELTNVYTADDAWARLVLDQLRQRVDNISDIRCLGFCVSIEHARFMARIFDRAGVAAEAVWGESSEEARTGALEKLRSGELNVLFSVDLFNEGVDLPRVDTLLLLRPTDSATLFLQQLGRGLRRSSNKNSCLVLDFVGQHRREFRFDRRLGALLGGSRKQIERQVEEGFPYLPAGCFMELDRKSTEIVLDSVRQAVPSKWNAKVEELRRLREEGRGDLAAFLEDSGLELEDVYTGGKSWSDLQEAAGAPVRSSGPEEISLRRACGRMLHVDDRERLDEYRRLLQLGEPPVLDGRGDRSARLARMLVSSLLIKTVGRNATLDQGIRLLWGHPQVRSELLELFDLLAERISHQHYSLASHPHVPLQIHAKYTRLEILAAFQHRDSAKAPPWQTGVQWVDEEQVDLLAFTLDKSSGHFSPTTRYRDYAISPELIHWESQSVTRADSDTGLRYQNHEAQGSGVMLFARLQPTDRAFWFLGPAIYVSHQKERPMAVTWRLERPLPGDLFNTFAAAVA